MLIKKGKRILSILIVLVMVCGLSLTVIADAFVAIEGVGTFTQVNIEVFPESPPILTPVTNSRYSAFVQADMFANGNLRLYVDISRTRGTNLTKRIVINTTLLEGQYTSTDNDTEARFNIIEAEDVTAKIDGFPTQIDISIIDNMPFSLPGLGMPVDFISIVNHDPVGPILFLGANKSVLKSLRNYQNSQFDQR
jgi:hypothetical protein